MPAQMLPIFNLELSVFAGIHLMQNHPAVLLAACTMFLGVSAQAQSVDNIWSFNGFGTIGSAYSDEKRADYTPAPLNPSGPGASGAWDAGLDSRAGFQLSAQPTPRLSAVLQVVAEREFDGDVAVNVEWANLRYEISPALSVRLGRIALGNFMVSDYRKVGNALPWIRPPAELYHIVGITNSDGIDVSYQTTFGRAISTTEVNYGRNSLDTLDGFLKVPNLWVVSNRLEIEGLTLRASYSSLKLVYDILDPLWDAYRAFGPAGETVARNHDASGEWSSFASVGMKYDPGNWFLMAELGIGVTPTEFGNRRGWYTSGGYRFGDVTPYAIYARSDGGYRDASGLDASSYPGFLLPTITTLNEFLNYLQTAHATQQHTSSIGLRWDVLPNINLKAQYDRVSVRDGSFGTFSNFEPNFRPSRANVFSFALDYVF